MTFSNIQTISGRAVKKPEILTVLQWNGKNLDEIKSFLMAKRLYCEDTNIVAVLVNFSLMSINLSDVIIKKSDGNFFVVNESEFLNNYQPINQGGNTTSAPEE